ncbi:hypothetical protein F2Q70_00038482 [Brassica cretica]|uniref:Uncharacterized protein n=1 Tax=Brassica cretica TaxID=69181 RepID=A0A8S9K3Y5_BRACR|nr:hypothetical protein F2Q70_00038482 [Brassica cretica]
MIKGDPQLSLIPHYSDGVMKYRVRSRCFSQPFLNLRALLIAEMIDKWEESFEAFTKTFQCHQFEVNPTVISDVMPVLLNSGQSVSLERESCRGDEGTSIDGAPLVSIDGDSRTWDEYISRPT